MKTGNSGISTGRMVVSSLMICLVLLGTVLFRIPVPMTQGYVHLGDAMIFIGVMLLGRKQGAVSAALGSVLGDILGGYAFWAPWTFVIKFAMAYTAGYLIDKSAVPGSHGEAASRRLTAPAVVAMAAGGLVMCAGYLIAERIMYGSWAAALIGLPWNTGQFIVGIAVTAAAHPLFIRIEQNI
ncbi:MAG: ECF transporter S component [Mogibacterium sp.]|nr:ECF transporter S component [Mogibacterium sp.]